MLTATTTAPARRTAGRCAHRMRGLAATAARHVAVDLSPQAVEQIAIRVAQLLRHERPQSGPSATPTWMTAKELAHHLKLNPAWVYEHAEELGAIRTGDGPKARMRFDLHTATQALRRHQKQSTPVPASGSPRRRPQRPGVYPADTPLLQVRNPYARGVRACRFASHTPVSIR
jgi:hypothetical protein